MEWCYGVCGADGGRPGSIRSGKLAYLAEISQYITVDIDNWASVRSQHRSAVLSAGSSVRVGGDRLRNADKFFPSRRFPAYPPVIRLVTAKLCPEISRDSRVRARSGVSYPLCTHPSLVRHPGFPVFPPLSSHLEPTKIDVFSLSVWRMARL